MPRPIKCRKVGFIPEQTYFVPENVVEPLEIILKLEEVEAMRLKDIENLSQEESAQLMQVSRQTFQNIIDSARNKLAVALTEGKAIRIGGGNYKIKDCKLKCDHCGNNYRLENIQDRHRCPICKSEEVICLSKGQKCHPECMK
jgi:predicted DNA-binding protein (UPF0251 family)